MIGHPVFQLFDSSDGNLRYKNRDKEGSKMRVQTKGPGSANFKVSTASALFLSKHYCKITHDAGKSIPVSGSQAGRQLAAKEARGRKKDCGR